MTPDVNVLVAASRSDHPHHSVAHHWLEQAIDPGDGTGLSLLPMVLASFLRLVTSPRIFKAPTPTDRAVAFADALLELPGVRLLALGDEWPRLRQMCLEHTLAGNDLPDAWLAAAALQHGEQVVTFDRDFKRLLGRGRFTLLNAKA